PQSNEAARERMARRCNQHLAARKCLVCSSVRKTLLHNLQGKRSQRHDLRGLVLRPAAWDGPTLRAEVNLGFAEPRDLASTLEGQQSELQGLGGGSALRIFGHIHQAPPNELQFVLRGDTLTARDAGA